MLPSVIPVQLVLFQCLLLLITVAIEAVILRYTLNLTRKNSIEYSLIINLFSSIFVWLLFFLVYNFNFLNLKLSIVGYILFNNLSINSINFKEFWIFSVIYFLLICFIEFRILDFIEAIIKTSEVEQIDCKNNQKYQIVRQNDTSKAFFIVIANSCSHLIIIITFSLLGKN